MAFPNDTVGYTTYFNIPKPYIAQRNWMQYFYDGMDIIDTKLEEFQSDISDNISLINTIQGDIASLESDMESHVGNHEAGGVDVLSLTGLSGDNISVDTIDEKTVGNGITVDGVILKDGQMTVLGDPTDALQVATKQYIDNSYINFVWQSPVIDFLDLTTAEPATPAVGDRYINTATGDSSVTTQAVIINFIYEWNGTNWTPTPALTAMSAWVDNDAHSHVYVGGNWVDFLSQLLHDQLGALQGGTTAQYYHLTLAEHTNVLSLAGNSELVDWLDNVVLDTDGSIHLEDNAYIYFGDSDDGYIGWNSTASQLDARSDMARFKSIDGFRGFGHNSSAVYMEIQHPVSSFSGFQVRPNDIVCNVYNTDTDFIIKKDDAVDAFRYDAGLDEFIINADIDLSDDIGIYFGNSDDASILWDSTANILEIDGGVIFNSVLADKDFIINGDTREAYRFDAGNVEHIFKEDMYFVNSGAGLPYASISCLDSTNSLTLTTQNVWYQSANFTINGASNMATPDHTNDHITIVKTGVYKIDFAMAFSGTGSQVYEIEIQKNNGATRLSEIHTERKLGTAGDIGSVSACGIVSLTAGDTIELWIRCTTGGGNSIVSRDMNINLFQIGG
jgi:hypothetical protein